VLVDAYPGLGKSTAVLDYAGQYYRNQIALRGAITADGHRRVPLIYIALTGNTHIRGLNAAICRFYGLPDGGDADTLAERAKDAALSLATTVFVIDDIHFLAPYATDANAVRMANHLKFLSNTFPVTLVYVGVAVRQRGLLVEGRSPEHALAAQFGRRTTALTLHRFDIEDEAGRQQWRRLLLSIERLLVLTDLHPGMLADDLSDYLYARSTGHFASLMVLINRGVPAGDPHRRRTPGCRVDGVGEERRGGRSRPGGDAGPDRCGSADLQTAPQTPPHRTGMTGWEPRRLPIVFPSIPGEALDSWIECYARRLHASTTGFLTAAGMTVIRMERPRPEGDDAGALGRAGGALQRDRRAP